MVNGVMGNGMDTAVLPLPMGIIIMENITSTKDTAVVDMNGTMVTFTMECSAKINDMDEEYSLGPIVPCTKVTFGMDNVKAMECIDLVTAVDMKEVGRTGGIMVLVPVPRKMNAVTRVNG